MRSMRPELSENSTFLRYYEILQRNPSSVVFAPLAEVLNLHKCYEEAITVCKKGLEHNPEMVSGRVALSRAYVGVKNYNRAKEEALKVLAKMPNHPESLEIIRFVNGEDGRFFPTTLNPEEDERWNTLTMAEIFLDQNNFSGAEKILKNILAKDPDNKRAKDGLSRIRGEGGSIK